MALCACQSLEKHAVQRTLRLLRLRSVLWWRSTKAVWSAVLTGDAASAALTASSWRRYEEHARGILGLPCWHKRRGLPPEICDPLTPGNSTVDFRHFRGVLCRPCASPCLRVCRPTI